MCSWHGGMLQMCFWLLICAEFDSKLAEGIENTERENYKKFLCSDTEASALPKYDIHSHNPILWIM